MSWKLSRTVLKPSRSGDASAQGNPLDRWSGNPQLQTRRSVVGPEDDFLLLFANDCRYDRSEFRPAQGKARLG